MPKVVDHDARRAEIGAAVQRVILRDGIEQASVRTVAAEAGWSAGAVRHYFPDHPALVRFAVEQMLVDAPARMRRRLEARPSRAAAARLLEELLPLDPERHVEMQLWLAVAERARHAEGFETVRDQIWDGCRFVARVAVAWVRGLPAPVDLRARLPAGAEADAAVLQALLDGLALELITYPERLAPGEARRALARHLAGIGAEPTRADATPRSRS